MRFKEYITEYTTVVYTDKLDELTDIAVDELIDVSNQIVESTTVTGGDIAFNVPKINKEKYRKLNKRTNRMKNFKKTKFYKTDIKPEDRTFKNIPRYANKKPICRFQDWLCIETDSEYSKKGASGGKAANGEWIGFSHRAVFGFKPGHEVKKGHIAIKKGRQLPYTIKSDADAKWHAIEFSRQVS